MTEHPPTVFIPVSSQGSFTLQSKLGQQSTREFPC